jgi:NACalpha-BTF3-like transcription factor
LEQVLSAGDPNIDRADGHPIAYTAILQAFQSFEKPPIFVKEDSEQVIENPEIAEKVPEWMNLASQVATGNRGRVLEDGPDKMNSDDEEKEHVKPDEEPNMYVDGMDPTKGPVMLSSSQAAAQRAAAQALKSQKAPPRSQSPVGGSSDDDDPARANEWIWSQTKGC